MFLSFLQAASARLFLQPDPIRPDQLAAGLQSRSKERIRCTAHKQALGIGKRQHGVGLLTR
jgi:hypothetical protein